MPRPRTRAGEPSDTRRRLVDGARSAVATHGMRGLTVEHCIRAAGLSRRTFYQYFRDREAVILALYERVAEEMVEVCGAAVDATPDPLGRVTAGIEAYLDFQQDGGRVIAELQAEAANPSSPLWPVRVRALDLMGLRVQVLVRDLLGAEIDPAVFRALYAGLEELVLHARQGGPLAPDRRARISELAVPMFVAVLSSAKLFPPR